MSFTERELPVGSLVNYDSGEDGILLCQIAWLDLKLLAEKTEWFNSCHKPIPLTEEWLLKMGFKKLRDFSGFYFEKDEHRVYLFSETFEFELTLPNGNRVNLHRSYKANVHTLQNLYFHLLMEELTIKTDEP